MVDIDNELTPADMEPAINLKYEVTPSDIISKDNYTELDLYYMGHGIQEETEEKKKETETGCAEKGEINPYNLFISSMLPNWIQVRTEISPSVKMTYARLCQYAGKNGKCFPSQEALGKATGMSTRQAKRNIEVLIAHKLIACVRRGRTSTNTYIFKDHEWITGRISDKTSMSPRAEEENTKKEVSDKTSMSPRDKTSMSPRDKTSMSPLIKEENQLRESNEVNHVHTNVCLSVSQETLSKKHKSSMSEKVKLKTKQNTKDTSVKKSKLTGKVKHNTPANMKIINFWNTQEGLRTCKIDESSKTFSASLRSIHLLRSGKMKITAESLSGSTQIEWFDREYSDEEIQKGILNLNTQATKIDVYPIKKKWLEDLSIPDAIYNPRHYFSPLLEALHYGVKPVFDPMSKLTEDEKDAVKQLQTYFKTKHDKVGPKIDQQILQLVQEFKDLRIKHKLAWGDKYMLRQRGWHSAPVTVDCLVYDYIEFLTGRTVSDYEVPDNLEPFWLKQNSKAWNAFSMAYYHRYDVDVITGRG